MNRLPQFKVRIVKGITELRLRDDPLVKRELADAFKNFAPLLEGNPLAPSFEDLKGLPELKDFGEGKRFERMLCVRGYKGEVLERSVTLLDERGEPCAMARWRRGEGTTFEILN